MDRAVGTAAHLPPPDVGWDLFLGRDATTGEQRVAPAVREPLTAFAAPEVLGTVTEIDRACVLGFDTTPDERSDHVRLEIKDGTSHGARLVLPVAGVSIDERDAAIQRWGRVGVGRVAAAAAVLERSALAATASWM